MLADCGLQHEVNGVMTCFFTLCHLHHKCSAAPPWNPDLDLQREIQASFDSHSREQSNYFARLGSFPPRPCKNPPDSAAHLVRNVACSNNHSIVLQEVTAESDRMWEWQDFSECRCGQRQDADRKYSRTVHLCSAGCAPRKCKPLWTLPTAYTVLGLQAAIHCTQLDHILKSVECGMSHNVFTLPLRMRNHWQRTSVVATTVAEQTHKVLRIVTAVI